MSYIYTHKHTQSIHGKQSLKLIYTSSHYGSIINNTIYIKVSPEIVIKKFKKKKHFEKNLKPCSRNY